MVWFGDLGRACACLFLHAFSCSFTKVSLEMVSRKSCQWGNRNLVCLELCLPHVLHLHSPPVICDLPVRVDVPYK